MADLEASSGSSCAGCGAFVYACAAHDEFGKHLCTDCAVAERNRYDAMIDTRQCPRCSRDTRHWERENWAKDGREYCHECAKSLERIWFIANSCMECNRLFKACENRIVPPERILENDPYVKTFVVKERAFCEECYIKRTRKKFGAKVLNGKARTEKQASTESKREARPRWGALERVKRLLNRKRA